jgi:hypothetical protein
MDAKLDPDILKAYVDGKLRSDDALRAQLVRLDGKILNVLEKVLTQLTREPKQVEDSESGTKKNVLVDLFGG